MDVDLLAGEGLIGPGEACRLLACGRSSYCRYVRRDGLEAVMRGGQWCTSRQAVARFLDRLTRRALGLPAADEGRARANRLSKAEAERQRRLDAELAARGC